MPDFKSLFNKMPDKKNMSRLIIIFIIGLILIVYGSGKNGDSQKPEVIDVKEETTFSDTEYTRIFETKLEEILSQIKGVSEASVMISFKRGSELALAYDTKSTESVTGDGSANRTPVKEKSEQKEVVTVQSGNGILNPVVTASNYPAALGVIVVAYGADDPKVKADIISAVSAVVDVPNYKIQVFNK